MLCDKSATARAPALSACDRDGVAALKAKGDLAELMVAADILRRGHKVAIPYGEDWDYDLIVLRHGLLERVQVKHATSDGRVVPVRCRSFSLTAGRVREVKRYSAESVDWLAVYDATTSRCFYVPAAALGEGRSLLHLRLEPPRSGQRAGIRSADDYLEF
jgi:hypothetical protein